MREPSFNETLQIGIVVHDLETAMGTYVDDYGIGPWDIHEFNAGNAEDLHEHGRPVERSWRLATTMVGRVQWGS
jgi:methylmalonyl-CoA/ethylmalonyl-CoA epimerase